MKTNLGLLTLALFGVTAIVMAQNQSTQNQSSGKSQTKVQTQKNERSAGGEIASGSGNIGKGAANGAGNLAAGAGKGAVDLVTLHPIDAAASVGKGGVSAGKNVTVGTTKGTGKVVKGVGKGLKHAF